MVLIKFITLSLFYYYLSLIFVSCSSIYSTTTNSFTNKIMMDSSNLKLEYCDNCDLFLGGLFPIHAPKYMRQTKTILNSINEEYISIDLNQPQFLTTTANIPTTRIDLEDYYLNEMSCGEIKKERGIQRLEAMLYAIDLINNSTTLLPNIKIGARIFDTCDRDTIALEKCINFVSDYFILNDENIVNDFTCVSNNITSNNNLHASNKIPQKNKDLIHKRKVIGVIGAASSSVSIQVANLLRLFQVPQISYASTNPELSNKEKFPFFSRVLPSDTLQAEAMANLVHDLDWNYIATLNEEGNLGGIDSFITNAKLRKICISGSYTLSQTASEDDVRGILTEMYKQKNSRAVVVFLQDHNIRKLLRIANSLNMTGHFLWIASDSWGTKKESISTNDLAAEGAITFSPKSYEIKEFSEYFKKLKPKTNKRNPWFLEFWEEQFNCTFLENEYSNSNHHRRFNRRLCTGEENLNVTQDGFIHFVIDSVFAMAHAIQNLIKIHCAGIKSKNDLIKCQHKFVFKGPELLKAIRNVEFTSITGRKVEFLNSGDGLAPFEVFQYQQYESGKFGYKKITEWEKNKPFKLVRSNLKWRFGDTNNRPRSICKEECNLGEIKQGDDCCWVCVRCEENEFVNKDRKSCIKCPYGYGPDLNKTGCQKLLIEYMTFNSPFTIIPIIFSALGIVMSIYTIFVFIRYNETPIIKASGRELCYVLLAGILCCYLVTFPLVTKPTLISCLMQRFGFSLSLTICLSALFTKTNRLSRIFNNSVKQVKQASYVSPISQLVICFSIVSVQIIGIIIWVIVSPPGTSYDYDDPKKVILQCKTHNTHLAISFMYNIFLVILCTIYAVKTRKIPENFNEARFIGFTMYSICIIWVAFIPIYFGTTAAAGTSKTPKNNYKIQLTTMAMCLSLSATVILFCLFMPKLRVVLLKPNKNVRQKSSNIVKSVYKTHQQRAKESTLNNNLPSNTNQTNFEKSLTVNTGVSSGSTPSSPGLQTNKKLQNFTPFSNLNTNKLSTCSIKTKELSSTNENDDKILVETKPEAKKDSNNNNLIQNDFELKCIDSNSNSIESNKSSENNLLSNKPCIDLNLAKNLELSDKSSFKKYVASNKNETKNVLNQTNPTSKESSQTPTPTLKSDEYEYFFKTRDTSSKLTEIKKIIQPIESVKNTSILVEKLFEQKNKLETGQEVLNEKAIKNVVDKCFDQMNKQKKIPSPYLVVNNNNNNNNNSKKIKKRGTDPNVLSTSSQTSSNSSTLSINCSNDEFKQTIVEKPANFLNAPTNTILLSSPNDINDLYSLKITFV